MNTKHSEISPAKIEEMADLRDWQFPQPGEEHYGPNQLIAAYNVGVKKGLEKSAEMYGKLIDQKFRSNINQAGDDTNKVIGFMHSKGIQPGFARLKFENWDNLKVMIGIPMKDYLSEPFNEVLDFVGQLEEEQRDDFYKISFIFSYLGENLDEEKIWLDGFQLSHKSLV